MGRKRRRIKKKNTFIFILIVLVIVVSIFVFLKMNNDKNLELKRNKLEQDIVKHYNEFVITKRDADIYKLNGDNYTKVGLVGKGQELSLVKKDITYEDEYLKIDGFDNGYYIYYKDLEKIDKLSLSDDRYKNYIVFNKNVVTKDSTSFYDSDGKIVYQVPEEVNLPIIINKKDMYGVLYNGKLLYVKGDNVSVKDNKNTDSVNTKGIAVLNYHFFYDASLASERSDCNQVICLSTDNLKKHLNYIKDNNIFTPTMEELEMYIDGYIQLPKSVVLTIDDGWRADIGSNIMAEYELNGTVFLTTLGHDPGAYKNEYIETHSHGHDIHKQGVCSGGQGGGIKCLDKAILLDDLGKSREKLFNTTVFCYPFYEYNNYSIEVLKEAGFTMAFGGYGEGGYYKVVPGINKFKLPRYVIYSYTSVNNIASYIN